MAKSARGATHVLWFALDHAVQAQPVGIGR
jgi:hypothetical protein